MELRFSTSVTYRQHTRHTLEGGRDAGTCQASQAQQCVERCLVSRTGIHRGCSARLDAHTEALHDTGCGNTCRVEARRPHEPHADHPGAHLAISGTAAPALACITGTTGLFASLTHLPGSPEAGHRLGPGGSDRCMAPRARRVRAERGPPAAPRRAQQGARWGRLARRAGGGPR